MAVKYIDENNCVCVVVSNTLTDEQLIKQFGGEVITDEEKEKLLTEEITINE